jgi:hypothetical protein
MGMGTHRRVGIIAVATAAVTMSASPAWAVTFSSVSGVYAETADAAGEIFLSLKDSKCDSSDVYFQMKYSSGVFSTTRNSLGCGQWVERRVSYGPAAVYGRACVDSWRDSCTSWQRLH